MSSWDELVEYASLEARFKLLGCSRVLVKRLAPNDNTKNQIFLGNDPSELALLPTGQPVLVPGSSTRQSARDKKIIHFPLMFWWLTAGGVDPAPGARIIFYPQYPEVRLSGLLRGSSEGPRELLDPQKRGREPGRLLLIGINEDSQNLFGLLVDSNSRIAAETSELLKLRGNRPIQFWDLGIPDVVDSTTRLLNELCKISSAGWIEGTRLTKKGPIPYNATNGGGYTLEACLGILPNGYAAPDFLDWEVKQHGAGDFGAPKASDVTLFTPEPDGGTYEDEGVDEFLNRWGHYSNSKNRHDFATRHKAGVLCEKTGLTLLVVGFDKATSKFEADGQISLVSRNGHIAASWSFAKLLSHWKRKHSRAVYVPSVTTAPSDGKRRTYSYSPHVHLGQGTSFSYFLSQLTSGSIVYDPGIHSNVDGPAKKRNQFRISSTKLHSLYDSYLEVDACGPSGDVQQ